MRKIINSTFITLDGVVDNPGKWNFPYMGEDAQKYAYDMLFACDALIMGRATYEGFAASWPHMEEQTGDFGVRMNTMPKYAVSTTLDRAEWTNTTVISDDVVARIRALKEEPGQDILQYGFGRLSRTMVDNGLLDELQLWIHPLFGGVRSTDGLVGAAGFTPKFELAGTKVLSTGVVIASYRPAA